MATTSETPVQPDAATPGDPTVADGKSGELDDIMIAMDVVDTLRHDRRIVERELDDEGRRTELIKRLKEIYRGQGIEVPDAILEEGVKALREQRFVYDPPKDGLVTSLARLYVTRRSWGRYVIGSVVGLGVVLGAWYFLFELPKARKAEALRTELSETIPNALTTNLNHVRELTSDEDLVSRVSALTSDGLKAAKSGDTKAARQTSETVTEIVERLRQRYTVRVVSRPGELSGLWRIPDSNPSARNFYLIVEAIDARGEVLELRILNEETNRRERAKTWAIRVPRDVLERVERDKSDDGIIQDAVVATKERGQLEPVWRIETAGGAITRW